MFSLSTRRSPHFCVANRGDPEPIRGCTDSSANNYDPTAEVDDGTCTFPEPNLVQGCTDVNATNHDPLAEEDDGSCTYSVQPIEGCTDLNATNYNQDAELDDGSCVYSPIIS